MSQDWIPVMFLGTAAGVKAMMSVLDHTGALDKLPPWLRPQVTAAQGAVVGVLAALAGGVPPPEAILAGLGVMGISHHLHATKRGVERARAAKGSLKLNR